jgi:small redox-active disulfide protein 2
MVIQVLGTGCPKCKQLTANVHEALDKLGVDAEVVKVTDINEILKFNVMMTPAMAVDGDVKVVGKVARVDEIVEILG